jgi:hypothetical protein
MEATARWNGEVSAEIREQYGISIDMSTESAGIWIRAEILRTPEDLLTALEIGNALKIRLVADETNLRVGNLTN